MQLFQFSHTGLRETNQDRAFAGETKLFGQRALVFAVADGMGGMKAGDRAAEIAVETVARYAREVFPDLPEGQARLRESIAALFQEVNRRVWEFGQANGAQGMGTTLVLCVALPGRYLVANAGDSRAYYINRHEVTQITEDHSRVQELVRKGGMTPEAAKRSPYRNQLTNSLGEPHDILVDVFPRNGHYGIIDEDCVILLCSDGLHGDLTDGDLREQLLGAKDLATGCRNLVSLAFQAGSTDNITVAAAEFGHLPRSRRKLPVLPPIEKLRSGERPAPAAALPPGNARGRRTMAALWVIGILLAALSGAAYYYYGLLTRARPAPAAVKPASTPEVPPAASPQPAPEARPAEPPPPAEIEGRAVGERQHPSGDAPRKRQEAQSPAREEPVQAAPSRVPPEPAPRAAPEPKPEGPVASPAPPEPVKPAVPVPATSPPDGGAPPAAAGPSQPAPPKEIEPPRDRTPAGGETAKPAENPAETKRPAWWRRWLRRPDPGKKTDQKEKSNDQA